MEKNILIGGKAGEGVAQTSWLLGRALTRVGFFVFNYKDYPSLIRGGHNFNVLKISDKPVYSHSNLYDIIIALDENTVNIHKKSLKKGGFILANKKIKGKNIIFVDTKNEVGRIKAPQIVGNDILAGVLWRMLGLPAKVLQKVAYNKYKNKLITKAIEIGYAMRPLKKISGLALPKDKANYFLSGNEAIGAGAVAAGIDAYIAYPMTPATPVLHYLARKQKESNILILQLENEIAVANAALGASYSGASVMVGTSGGGFALMSEAMSLQGMSEIPLVAYLSQRTSPSTGVPTYSSQGDLKFALNIGQGEFPRIVVAPGDAEEAFYRTVESFYLSQKYRVLSIIIGDKHLGESDYSFSSFNKLRVLPQKYIAQNPRADYKSYLITKSGVSPRAVPGQGPVVRATSYEHDEYGYTTENPLWTKRMNQKRIKKLEYLKKEIAKLSPISLYGKGENLIIGWGSTKGAILDSLPSLSGFRFMQISYISPFPAEQVKREIKKSNKVVLVENNVTGLLGQIIREKTGLAIKNKILKYDARPFIPKDIISAL